MATGSSKQHFFKFVFNLLITWQVSHNILVAKAEEINNWNHLTDLSATPKTTTVPSTQEGNGSEKRASAKFIPSLASVSSIENIGSGMFSEDPSDTSSEALPTSSLSSRLPLKSQSDLKPISATNTTETPSTISPVADSKMSKKFKDALNKNKTCCLSNSTTNINTLHNHNPNKVVAMEDLTDDLGLWEAPEYMQKQYPYFLAGYDDEDRPIWMAEIGKFNFRKIVEAGGDTLLTFDKYVKQAAYHVVKSMEAREVSAAVYLVDMDGLEFSQLTHVATVAYVLKLARNYRDLILAHLGGGIVVNASFMAETLINILRPIFSRALERIEIYGTSKAKWLPMVLRKYPRDSLPPWYGGYQNFRPLQVYG